MNPLTKRIADAAGNITGAEPSPARPDQAPAGPGLGELIANLRDGDLEEAVVLPARAILPPKAPATPRASATIDAAAPVPAPVRPEPIKAIFPYERSQYLWMALNMPRGINDFAKLPFRSDEPDFKVEMLIDVALELLRTYGIIHALHSRIVAIRSDGDTPRHQGDINLCLGCLQAERQIKDRLAAIEKRLEGRADG